jgi:4-amino-4-deoxy-L-arabinose transferase-like glycosyltransferase
VLRRVLLVVGGIAALGLALRVWYLLDMVGDSSLVGDGLEFHGLAGVLSEGRGFVSPLTAPGAEAVPTAHKPPLYPLTLAGVSSLGWTGYVSHQVASALIGTATVVVCALLAQRLAGNRAAVIAAVIGAAYPVFLVADASLRAESLFGLLIALALLAAYRVLERPTTWRLVQLGAVIGLAALTRSEGLLLLFLLAAPVVWRGGAAGRVRRLAVVAGVCVLTLSPWLIRNWIVFDEPVVISTSYGDLIAGANCDETYSGRWIGSWSFECVLSEPGEDEAEIARGLRERGLTYAGDHADRLPAVLVARALRPWGFWDPDGEATLKTFGEGRSKAANWVGLVACWLLLLLAPVGLLALRRRGKPVLPLLAPFAMVLIVSLTAYGILRFRAPADVALVVLGAIALDALLPAGAASPAAPPRRSSAAPLRSRQSPRARSPVRS